MIFAGIRGRFYLSAAVTVFFAAAAACVVYAGAMGFGVMASFKQAMERFGADVIVLPAGAETEPDKLLLAGEPESVYMDGDIADRIRTVPGVVTASPQLFLESASASCCDRGDTLLIGFEPETDFTLGPWVGEIGGAEGETNVVVGSSIKRPPGFPLKFYNQQFRVSSRLEPTGIDFFDRAVFIPLDAAYKMIRESAQREDTVTLDIPPNSVSSVLVKSSVKPEIMAGGLSERFPGIKALPARGFVGQYRDRISGLRDFSVLLLAMLTLLCLTGAVFLMYMSILERKREAGLIRAMGATRWFTVKMILAETALLSPAGGIAGSVFAGVTLRLFRGYFVYRLGVAAVSFPAWSYLPIIAGLAAIALISAAVPATRIVYKEPYSVMRESGFYGTAS